MEQTRALRNWLGDGRRFQRVDLLAQRPRELDRPGRFRTQLDSARVEVASFRAPMPLSVRIAEFSELALAHIRVSELSGRWNRVANASDQALIIIVQQGSLELRRAGYATAGGTGAFIVLPGSGVVDFETAGEVSDIVCLAVPGRVTASVTESATTGIVQSKDAGVADEVFGPAALFGAGVCGLSAADVPDGDLLRAVAEETARAVVQLAGGVRVAGERTLYGAAIALIRSGFDSPTLTSETLAENLGVSLRTLQSAFRAESRTVAGVIRQARAVGAVRLRHEQPQLSQARIAALAGFGSVDSMQRAVRVGAANEAGGSAAAPAEHGQTSM